MLHHEPPAGSRVTAGLWAAAGEGDATHPGRAACAAWARTYRPDYLLCGDLHRAPFAAGGAWADRLEGTATWAFNPGRDDEEGGQSRIVKLDAAARTAC